MKMVKGITKVNANKYGIEVAPQYDFNDDGNRFRGFQYKGIPMTQCRADGICYLCIRVDYLNNNFTYNEWAETEEYDLCDKFNGVTEFDIEELVENLERVIAKIDEMNANAKVSEAEIEKVKSIVNKEVSDIENFLDEVKHSDFEWWKLDGYDFNRICDRMKSLNKKIDLGHKLINTLSRMSIKDQKIWLEKAKRSVNDVLGAKWYMEQIDTLISKVK